MSEESFIYGCIVGAHGGVSNWYDLYPLNQAVIDALPLEDAFPPLTRGMFTVPMDWVPDRAPFYRNQIIHFGGSFNHMSDRWHLWLEKFEALLRQLHWYEARLHLEIDYYGHHDYRWQAEPGPDGKYPFVTTSPAPTTRWTFTGGARSFKTR